MCDSVVMRSGSVLVFFFFQAEDGIRDDLVTGVQTCALPICLPLRETFHHQPKNSNNNVIVFHFNAFANKNVTVKIKNVFKKT